MFDFSPFKIVIALLLLALLLFWSRRFLTYSPFPQKAKKAIMLLRWLTILLLLLLWFRFEYTFRQIRYEKPQVAIVIDNSESMRYHQPAAEKLLESLMNGTQLAWLRENAELHWYAGYDEAFPFKARRLTSLAFDGNYTNLAELLSNVADEYASGTLDGILLFSDGQSSVGIVPDELQLKGIGRLINIGVGDTLQELLPTILPSREKIFASDADTLKIRYALENRSPLPLSGQISVSLSNQSEKITLPVKLTPGRQETFQVKFPPQNVGNQLLEWQFRAAGTDSLIALSTKVPVKIRPYLYQLHIISEKPNPDAAFVRNVLSSADQYEIHNILMDELPEKPDQSDALLLFASPEKASEILTRFPADMPCAFFYQSDNSTIEWVENYLLEAYYPFLLTGTDLESSQSDWLALPPAILSHAALPGKALVMAEKPTPKTIISLTDRGIHWGIQGMWRWGLAGYEKSWQRLYHRHIIESVEWLVRQDQRDMLQWRDDFVAVSRYEQVRMQLSCNFTEETLREKSRLVITVLDENQSELWRQTISEPEDENIIEWRSEQAGKFTMAAALYSENTRLAADSAHIEVSALSPERESKGCDAATLKKMSAKNNGFFTAFSDDDTLDFYPSRKQMELHWRFDAGSDYRFLIILLIPAIAEWIIRKRNGGI